MQTCTVAYNEGHNIELERKLLLEDAISDLPAVISKIFNTIFSYCSIYFLSFCNDYITYVYHFIFISTGWQL